MYNARVLVGFVICGALLFPARATPETKKYPYSVGEKLTYSIKVLGNNAGTASIMIGAVKKLGGQSVYVTKGIATSAGVFDNILHIENKMISYIDQKTLKPLKMEMKVDFRGQKRELFATFDRKSNTLKATKNSKGKVMNRSKPIKEDLQDILSAFYFLRMQPMKEGSKYKMDVFGGWKIYEMEVVVEGTEEIWTRIGPFKCFRIKATAWGKAGENSKITKKNPQKLTLWMTTDFKRYPVKMAFNYTIGSVEAQLLTIEKGK